MPHCAHPSWCLPKGLSGAAPPPSQPCAAARAAAGGRGRPASAPRPRCCGGGPARDAGMCWREQQLAGVERVQPAVEGHASGCMGMSSLPAVARQPAQSAESLPLNQGNAGLSCGLPILGAALQRIVHHSRLQGEGKAGARSMKQRPPCTLAEAHTCTAVLLSTCRACDQQQLACPPHPTLPPPCCTPTLPAPGRRPRCRWRWPVG